MNLSNNGRDIAPTGYLLSPNEASSTVIGLHLIELLAKEVPWESSNNSGCYLDCRLLSTKKHQVPIAEDNIYITH